MMERRFISSEATQVRMDGDKENRTIHGYASVFYDGTEGSEYQLWGEVKERIMPGAFDRAIRDRDDTRALFNHDPNLVLGRTTSGTLSLSVDSRGLKYEIDPPASRADVIEAIDRGDVTGSSVGFIVTDETWRIQDEVEIREIHDVQLLDVSPVTFPAYSGTQCGVRADGKLDEARASYDAWKSQRESEAHSTEEQRKARLRVLELEQGA